MNIDTNKLVEKVRNQRNAAMDEAAMLAAAIDQLVAENDALKKKIEREQLEHKQHSGA